MKVSVWVGWLRFVMLFAAATPLCSCLTAPVGSALTVPDDAAQTCDDHCGSIGLRLSAVAIMANNVGCVCEAAPSISEASSKNAITGGMATIMLQEQQRQQQQQQQRQQQQQQPPPQHY